jgi:hypothetical protein
MQNKLYFGKRVKYKVLLHSFFLTAFLLTECNAQSPTISPRDSVKTIFDGKKITINYGKPSMRRRKIFGGFVRYYRVWRTGDGAATTLTTEVDLELDGAVVPRGVYTLYTLPTDGRCKLIINKQTGQWGTIYNSQLDLARIDLKITKLKTPVENLAFKLEKNGNSNGTLKIEWENTSLSVPFHINADGAIPSPRDSVILVLEGKNIAVNYGRPSMRGRKIIGGVVPYGVVWRTGANDATSFITESELILGGIKIPRGSYTLYTLPSSRQWKLIVNKQTGQWGTVYDKKLDLARIPLKEKTLKHPVEKFTITLERTTENSGVMILAWEKTQLSVKLQVK